MRGAAVRPIVIAAGGTGGHFFPAEALAARLIARGHRVVLMTDARSGALQSPVFANREHHILSGAGFAGKGRWQKIRAVFALLSGILQARRLMQDLNPAAVVGFGGYPSIPPVLATRLLRAKPAVILHEQNAVLGRANRFLARWADILALGFAETTKIPETVATKICGNPVRPALQALAERAYEVPGERIELLVLGGSLGARIFSDVVPEAISSLPQELRVRLHITQQCRVEDLARVRAAYKAAAVEADLAPFFTDVGDKFAASHLVISRAGASSCAEIAVVGRPAILVPLPGAIDDHQRANARTLAQAGGAWVLPQVEFLPDRLGALLRDLLENTEKLRNAAIAARTTAQADAADRLADMVEALMKSAEAVA